MASMLLYNCLTILCTLNKMNLRTSWPMQNTFSLAVLANLQLIRLGLVQVLTDFTHAF